MIVTIPGIGFLIIIPLTISAFVIANLKEEGLSSFPRLFYIGLKISLISAGAEIGIFFVMFPLLFWILGPTLVNLNIFRVVIGCPIFFLIIGIYSQITLLPDQTLISGLKKRIF